MFVSVEVCRHRRRTSVRECIPGGGPVPDRGIDIADLLEAPHDDDLRRWTRTTGRKLHYAGWRDQGNTTARLFAAYAVDHETRKVILKYVPRGRKEPAEPANHFAAWGDCPDGFRSHLVTQPWDPIMLSGQGWILAQEVAAGDLRAIRPMSSLLRVAIETGMSSVSVADAAGEAVRAVIEDWNANHARSTLVTTGQHLDLLIENRLRRGHPLWEWAHEKGLLVKGAPPATASVLADKPNPFSLLLGSHPIRNRKLPVFHGRSHRDLHPGNLLFGADPTQFWLIDLARYRDGWPLTFDATYLLLTTTAHVLPALVNGGSRAAAIDLLLSEEKPTGAWLPQPYHDLVSAIHTQAARFATAPGLAQEWHEATLLSFLAGSLIMCGRETIQDQDKDWFLQLAAHAAERYIELGGVTSAPIQPQPPTTTRTRILAEDRVSLQAQTMPTVSRAEFLATAVKRRDEHAHNAGRRQILALTGEGGIGKSVLLGQYLDQLEASDQSVVLVACGNVPATADLSSVESVDSALGTAADPKHGRDGLLRLLAEQQAAHGAVALLVDTVDLLLTPDTAASIAFHLVDALDIADVVVTCRSHEFANHLRPVPRLAGRVTAIALPVLDKAEIVDWATRYLRTAEHTADHSSFIESMSGSISASRSLQQVCSLPVRLALACSTFADRGHLPEDLSVTGLYQAYWDIRIRAHGGAKELGRVS
jgi:hypothetical protein